MRIYNLLPVIIMVESFAAGIMALLFQRWGSACYWLAAGLLNLAVIYLVKRWG